MRIADLAARRVAVWGYGREGRAALTALRTRLPHAQISVFCSDAEAAFLRKNRDARDLSFDEAEDDRRHLQDDDDRRNEGRTMVITTPPDAAALGAFDVVVKSPGISAYRAEILEAEHNGTRFTSGTALWFAEHPEARTIAVTGTKGKSTVTALIAHGLRALGQRTALAGNIGLPLLELLDPPVLPDWWAIELSSFQTRAAPRADIGVVNNMHEEHLDWHGTRERYARDKLALAASARTLVANTALRVQLASHPRLVAFGGDDGWHVEGGAIRRGGQVVFDLTHSPLPGAHNASNLCAALAALDAAGEDAVAAAPAIAGFHPLPHRLQTLGERDGITWVDDSIATTPQATLEALASLHGREVVVLVGGHDRGLDWRAFADAVRATPPHAIVAMGANGPRIAAQLREVGGAYRLQEAATLDAAVACARTLARERGVILLSPGAPSFDQFRDYAARGCRFAELAGFDPAKIGRIEGLGIA